MKNQVYNTLVIAHRGGMYLYPENTMLAFDNSVKLGVDALELDIHITKDDILVINHDNTINRTSNGKGFISNFTYKELLNYNFGYRFKNIHGKYPYRDKYIPIPKLKDLFIKHNNMNMLIDIKNNGTLGYKASKQLKKLIYRYNMKDKVVIGSFNNDTIYYFREITKNNINTSASTNETLKFIIFNKLFLNSFNTIVYSTLQIPYKKGCLSLDKKSIINSAHRKNIKVYYWTINDRKEMKKLIKLGSDGIITDRPDILISILKKI